jgi:hypothetical protein
MITRQRKLPNMIQVFTVYRVAEPNEDPRAEFYTLSVRTEGFAPTPVVVREAHGFWDDGIKKAVLARPTYEESFDSWKEAERAFESHLRHRASEGFQHCFSKPNPFEGEIYRFIEAKT